MRVLILSISAGGGHVNAAKAVEKYIKINSPESEVVIIDTIKYINPILDKVVIGSYLKSLKLSPALFGKLYNLAETEDSIANFSSKINEIIIHKLIPLIDSFNPDIIVSTHPISNEMASILKAKGKIDIPIVTIMTDYAPHSFWIHPYIDAYIVSNDDMVNEMIERGVPRELIFSFGIPVKPEFTKKYSRKDTLTSLNLNPAKKTVLLMSGSLGLGKVLDLYQQLENIKNSIQVLIITGNNKKLYNHLMEQSFESQLVTRIIGYTTDVCKYMQSSDLLITKPGGLTVTEAIVSHIPMAIFSAIPGQEEKNADFLLRHQLAIDLNEVKNCSSQISEFLCDDTLLASIKKNCEKYAKPNSGNDIYNLLQKLTKSYYS
ncbi:MGDG synthase family glycosyltransferase [Clostridium oryzae]|uniref:Processive diacylglycerol beta-glucosyltransferase n=1 Tax=Clostridium oryzae TaxID=1450648 RepID=A0A1V4IUF1_9CLOT|nr:glycosyltransferase [Clostridium oryzae]OPJ63404.1 processive diacylglycerol beta-glucosyltransferase [Clostridium oryzae]